MNSRIYPTSIFDKISSNSFRIEIPIDDRVESVVFSPHSSKIIKSRSQARSIRKKTGYNNVITNDVFFFNLSWAFSSDYFGFLNRRTGMAIMRDDKVIWYSMPGHLKDLLERNILIEKYKKKMPLFHLKAFNNYG